MYEGEALRSSFTIGLLLSREARYVGESIRHEKEIWRVARRGYLYARALITQPRACHPECTRRMPARAQTHVHLQRTPSPTTLEKNPHASGLESHIRLFDENCAAVTFDTIWIASLTQ